MIISLPVQQCTVHYALVALHEVVQMISCARCAPTLRAVLLSLASLIADRVKLFSYTFDTHILE